MTFRVEMLQPKHKVLRSRRESVLEVKPWKLCGEVVIGGYVSFTFSS